MSRRRRSGRPISGILLLDKDPGGSSNAALQSAKRLFEARKAGHTGSLDPLASGLLPVCFGEATKVSGFLLDADKTYWVRARLGEKTATGDAEGEITETTATGLPDDDTLQQCLAGFVGEQDQIPPMYSAVKHQGKRLYELARAGIEVEREPRRIRVDEFRLVDADDSSFSLRIRCSKGTYVRTLVEDLAERLGTLAHVTALRRLAVGPFEEAGMVGLEALTRQRDADGLAALDSHLWPVASALNHWPSVTLDSASQFYLERGQPVQVPQAPASGWVRICDAAETLLAVGEVMDDGRIAPRRMFQARGS